MSKQSDLVSVSQGSGGDPLYIDTTNDRVGVGTSSPTAALDVRRSDTDGKIAEFHQSSGYGLEISSSTSVAKITSGYNQTFVFETGITPTERMRINASGDVGIGTSNLTGLLTLNGPLTGGIGATTTGGVTNWNDVTNARSGNGYTLLLGSHSNGPGGSAYYHAWSFEYSSKNGSGNLTQWAIPYDSTGGRYERHRYGGSWSSWQSF